MKRSVRIGKQVIGDTKKDQARKQIEDLTNRWKRALADYQNLEKRYEKEKIDFVQFANTNLILKLLTTLGHLERAAEHLKDDGINLIVAEFKKVLNAEGLEEIKASGEEFNPGRMEAVEVIKGGQPNKVAEVVSKGYLLKEKVLLPAKVKVYQEKPEEENKPISTNKQITK